MGTSLTPATPPSLGLQSRREGLVLLQLEHRDRRRRRRQDNCVSLPEGGTTAFDKTFSATSGAPSAAILGSHRRRSGYLPLARFTFSSPRRSSRRYRFADTYPANGLPPPKPKMVPRGQLRENSENVVSNTTVEGKVVVCIAMHPARDPFVPEGFTTPAKLHARPAAR